MDEKAQSDDLAFSIELEKRKGLFDAKTEDAFRALRAAAVIGDRPTAQLQLERAMAYADLRQQVENVARKDNGQDGFTYLAGSLFLYDCYSTVVRGPNEHLYYVSGVKLGSVLTLDRIVQFDVDEASPVHAKGNLASSHRELIKLDKFGHRLHGLFHRHPGKGPGSTRPSSTDMDTQERQERGKYPVVGAIFTADGFIRFFSLKNRFELITYGEGVERVDENVFRLTEIGELQKQTN